MVTSAQKKVAIGIIVLMVLAIAVTVYLTRQTVDPKTVALFTPDAGALPYTDLAGNPLSLDQYLGSTLVVTTWASWSPFSTNDLQMLSTLSAEFADSDTVFMALNRNESPDLANRFMASIGNVPGVVIALDPTDHFYQQVGGYAMPEVIIFNQKGQITDHYRGVVDQQTLKEAIQKALD